MQTESLLTFIEKSGKWKANIEVFAILIGYFFLLFEVIAESSPLLSETRNAYGKYSTPLNQSGIEFNRNTEYFALEVV